MEHQNVEYKQIWRDEYIKWICGFANASGGKIYIGIDDKGIVSGIENPKKLLEDIPNKTRDVLGILVDVNLKTKAKKNYLEIIVEPYPYPISYKGQYYYRSGSTRQELKGAVLDKFILKRQGIRWDGIPQPGLSVKGLSKEAIDYFKNKAGDTNRVQPGLLKEKPETLLEKLHLKTENGYFKKAVVLLFHPDPEKYITGAYTKIGFFKTDDDLAYQDEIHGNLFEQVEKIMDLLLTKYLKSTISYMGIHRIENYPVPVEALREAVLNAVVHKDYARGNPLQISVYNNKIIIWNNGELPEHWTVNKLKTKHPSQPFNPDIANCFFRAGLIEAWGRGTLKIISECKKSKLDPPDFKYDPPGFVIEFSYNEMTTTKPGPTVGNNAEKILAFIAGNSSITIAELTEKVGVSESTIKRIIKQLREATELQRVGSAKTGEWVILNDNK
jgi:ATP-dependent DNA helicase RecG